MLKSWLALAIGNSRLHWGAFQGEKLALQWNTGYSHPRDLDSQRIFGNHRIFGESWSAEDAQPDRLLPMWPQEAEDWFLEQNKSEARLPLCLASVVPEQTQRWRTYPHIRILELVDVPLQGMYSTLGLDRALAVWGAGTRYGFPQLVIDAGTALTFTGADATANVVGGAILPGLGTQFNALAANTAQLPGIQALETWEELPPRWAKGTEVAIASGVLYTLLAGIQGFVQDWQQQFPQAAKLGEQALSMTLTGGDARLIWRLLHQQNPLLASQIRVDEALIFWGMECCFDDA